MKKSIKYTGYVLLLLGVLLFFSCIEGEKIVEVTEQKSFADYLMENVWWLFGLFIGSLLLNLFQLLNLKKTKNHYRDELSRKGEVSKKENYGNHSFQPKTMTLNVSEVKKVAGQVYVQLQQSLSNSYHKDCIAAVSLKFESLKSDTISEATLRSFKNKEELQQFINMKLEKDKSILRNELQNYVAKDDALQILDNMIAAENFVQTINTNIVSEEEIQNKVHQLKQMVTSELPNIISKPKLMATMEKLKKDIVMALQKMVQDNLVYYFAFADVNGTLSDMKKTKTIERDSAIQLSVNPEDVTKATFRLLLEKDDMMQAGIMSYDSLLIPICQLKSENFNSTGTRIEQIGPDGTMELENSIWKVKNKLPIKVI